LSCSTALTYTFLKKIFKEKNKSKPKREKRSPHNFPEISDFRMSVEVFGHLGF